MPLLRPTPPEGGGFDRPAPLGWRPKAFGAVTVVGLALTTTLLYAVAKRATGLASASARSATTEQAHPLDRLEGSVADADRKLADLVRKLDGLAADDAGGSLQGPGVPGQTAGTTETADRAVPPTDRLAAARKSARRAAHAAHVAAALRDR